MQQYTKTMGFIFLTFFISASGISQSTNTIIGKWKKKDGDRTMQLEIFQEKDGLYYSKIINDNNENSNNEKIVMKALEYNDVNKNYKGTMSPPDSSMTIDITVTVVNEDKLKIVGKKFTMTKISYLDRIK
jgi:uncharacterized protein (DUF2147 family)